MLPIILFLLLHSYTPEHTSHLYSRHNPNIACTEENHCFAWSKEHKCCKTDSSSNGVSMYKYTELYFSQSCQAEYFAVRALKLTGFFFVYLSFGSFPLFLSGFFPFLNIWETPWNAGFSSPFSGSIHKLAWVNIHFITRQK